MKKINEIERSNNSILPFLVFVTADGSKIKHILNKEKIIIGRLKDLNDISLQPDPLQLVTRYMHCSIENKNNIHWLIDNASKNGTFLKRNNSITKVQGEIRLQDDDKILILKDINAEGITLYWEFLYKDPLATSLVVNKTPGLVYDWVQATLFIDNGVARIVIDSMTPLEHKLIRFMDEKNKANENVPVMCSYDELISAVWDDAYPHTVNDVNHLVQGIRKKIEPNFREPVYLVNVRGMGYKLVSNLM